MCRNVQQADPRANDCVCHQGKLFPMKLFKLTKSCTRLAELSNNTSLSLQIPNRTIHVKDFLSLLIMSLQSSGASRMFFVSHFNHYY